MTGSPLRRFVITPVVISATVFGVLSLPLAILGKQPITIQFQDEPVFSGQLRDIAPPYLGLASILSLAAGTASVAVTGWQASSRKSAQAEEQLSGLAQNLKEKEELLEALKVSESRLAASGLAPFLDEEVQLELANLLTESVKSEPNPVAEPQAKPEPTQVPDRLAQPEPAQALKPPTPTKPVEKINDIQPNDPSTVKPLIITTSPLDPQPAITPQAKVQTAAAKFASAQTYMAYASRKGSTEPPKKVTPLPPVEVEKLQHQLQQMQAQMESLHKALATQHGHGAASPHPAYLKVVRPGEKIS
ncbi:MAG TPA: hypothetical protein DDZ80_25595 [Cyanobacteria bacterium UBA8803]|nr:hypothetical protein [Cyanobacteria bacterium UBA9273]HBL61669.1 hypothetical protein [Cyanobacteria bacterium UBA8803]